MMQENLPLSFSKFVIQYRWWLALAMAIVSVGTATIGEITWDDQPLPWHVVQEIIVLGIIIPLSFGVTLSLLSRAEESRLRAGLGAEYQKILGQQIQQASTRHEIMHSLVRCPSTILPAQRAAIYLYHPGSSSFDLEQQWWSEFHWPRGKAALPNAEEMAARVEDHFRRSGEIQAFYPVSAGKEQGLQGYCLELRTREELAGMLYMVLSPGAEPSPTAIQVLTSLAPQMAQALEKARQQTLTLQKADPAAYERQRITQNLQGILGQNIRDLQLKLDRLDEENSLAEIRSIHQDLERMGEIADEAYQQARSVLADLGLNSPSDLTAALSQLGQTIGRRANFQFTIESRGTERNVSGSTRHQIVLIFREALNNIEKHAHASLVKMLLIWGMDDFSISIMDDGQGFDPHQTIPLGHYGLTIMQERAGQISGRLSWKSSVENGTMTTLWISLPGREER